MEQKYIGVLYIHRGRTPSARLAHPDSIMLRITIITLRFTTQLTARGNTHRRTVPKQYWVETAVSERMGVVEEMVHRVPPEGKEPITTWRL